jgi:hypothetical protein
MPRIITASYHRNGVSGTPFYVATFEEDGEQFVCIDFTDSDQSAFAVLRMRELRAGNIGMHPLTDPDTGDVIEGTGGNAWRGDHYADDLREPIRDWVTRSYDAADVRRAHERGE